MKKVLATIILLLIGISSINIKANGETNLKRWSAVYLDVMNTMITISSEAPNDHPTDDYKTDIRDIFYKYTYLAYTDFGTMTPEQQDVFEGGKELVDIKVNLDYINKNPNQKIEVSKELYEMLLEAEQIRVDSDGYFDYSIGLIIDAWKRGITKYDKKEMPDEEFQALLSEVDAIPIEQNPAILTVEDNKYYVEIKETVKLDLGAFAKGYATQLAVDYLHEKGIKHYLISSGTSSIAVGVKSTGESYNIALSEPVLDKNMYAIVKIKNATLTTSGDYEQYFTYKGERFHHIISPKTKTPVTSYHTLSIAGLDAGLMDAASTALFSMSINEATKYLEKIGAQGIFYQTDLKIITLNNQLDFVSFEFDEHVEPVSIGKYLILGTYILISIGAVTLAVIYFKKNSELFKQNPKLRIRRDLILFAVLVLIFGGGFLNYHFWPRQAATYADITYRNEIYIEIDFNRRDIVILKQQDDEYPKINKDGTYVEVTLLGDFKEGGVRQEVVIQIDFMERRIKVSDEKSPNNYCSKQGWTKHQYIICLPNSVSINFRTGSRTDGVL